jgi:transcriptional regulator with XRE-family HTH domain
MKGKSTMEWKEAKKQLLQKKSLKKAYDEVDLQYEIGKMISDARIAKKMTQGKLAELINTKQPSIARIEKGTYLPSLIFLQRIAKAFNTQLLPPRFEFLEDRSMTTINLLFIAVFPDLSHWSLAKKSIDSVTSYTPSIGNRLNLVLERN